MNDGYQAEVLGHAAEFHTAFTADDIVTAIQRPRMGRKHTLPVNTPTRREIAGILRNSGDYARAGRSRGALRKYMWARITRQPGDGGVRV